MLNVVLFLALFFGSTWMVWRYLDQKRSEYEHDESRP
jgi:hypothetical protein